MTHETEKDFALLIADVLAEEDDEDIAGPRTEAPGTMFRRAFARAEAKVAEDRRQMIKKELAAHKGREKPGEASMVAARHRLSRLSVANDDDGEKLTMAARNQNGDGTGDGDVMAEMLAELSSRED